MKEIAYCRTETCRSGVATKPSCLQSPCSFLLRHMVRGRADLQAFHSTLVGLFRRDGGGMGKKVFREVCWPHCDLRKYECLIFYGNSHSLLSTANLQAALWIIYLAFSAYRLLKKEIPVSSPEFVWSLEHGNYQIANGELIQDPWSPTLQCEQNGYTNPSDLRDPVQKSILATAVPGYFLWPS